MVIKHYGAWGTEYCYGLTEYVVGYYKYNTLINSVIYVYDMAVLRN